MTLQELENRRNELQQSLNNLQQSFYIVTGHLAEVNFQIKTLKENCSKEELAIEEVPAVE